VEQVVLILGSNQGDRLVNLKRAIDFLEESIGAVMKRSRVYTSESWGYDGQEFLNQVIVLQSAVYPLEILRKIKEFEKAQGRIDRIGEYMDRVIDIDILYIGAHIIDLPVLKVPHRSIENRRFVLIPLAEILSVFMHPVLAKTSEELLESCEDLGKVELYHV